jgi:taurine dioxygenase
VSGFLTSTPLSPAVGVVVESYNFGIPPSTEQAEAIRGLLWEYHLILFPAVNVNLEQHRGLVEIFGPVADEFGNGQYYSLVRSPETDQGGELLYHCDFGFTSTPLEVISLYGVDIPAVSARTGFANGVRAYQQLSAGLRARLEGQLVLHASDVTIENQKSSGRLHPEDLSNKQYTAALHPAVLRHPKTAEQILFLNEYMSIRFEGLSRKESDLLLSETLSYLLSPGNVYEHTWHQGDLIIFDNIALSHKRTNGPGRTLRRVVVGKSPFLSVLPAAMTCSGGLRDKNRCTPL